MAFPERLKQLRKQNNLTQAQLAKEVGVIDRTIRRYEANDVEPTLSKLIKIAKYFNVTVDYLIDAQDYSETNKKS